MPKGFKSLSDQQVVSLIKDGAVGVLPTDTIYGLVALAANENAVARLYKLKNRDHKPGTVIAASIEQLVDLGIKERYLKAVQQFWPGAVSVEIPHSLSYLHQGTFRQAFRIPKDEGVQQLLQQTGPLLTSSANHPGKPEAKSIADAKRYFSDKLDFYVDGGDLSDRAPSTIIRIVDDAIEIIREGAVKIEPNE